MIISAFLIVRDTARRYDHCMSAEPMTTSQITSALSELPGWTFDSGDNVLSKKFEFEHFKEAMSFLVRVAFEAEAMNHHPDIHNVYKTVTLKLNTHDAGGKVTGKDVKLAKAIEHLNWLGK